jgi:hypothetical protein
LRGKGGVSVWLIMIDQSTDLLTEGASDGCESCAAAGRLGGAEEGERHFCLVLSCLLVVWLDDWVVWGRFRVV